MLLPFFSPKLVWGSYIVSIGSYTFSKKIQGLICSITFLSPDVELYFYESTIPSRLTCCCHVWAGLPSCYLDMFDNIEWRVFRAVGSSLVACFELVMAYCWHVVSLILVYRYYLVDAHRNWLKWFQLLILVAHPLAILIGCRYSNLSFNIHRFFKNVFVNCSFPQTARLWIFGLQNLFL